jgi:heat shock protein HslJ
MKTSIGWVQIMSHKSLFSQQTGRIVTLAVGMIGITATNPAIAQPAFKRPQPVQMAQASSLAGSWRLVAMGEPASAVVPQANGLTAEFADGRISGSGGCNRFMGGYKTQGEKLMVEPLASTSMACEGSAMGQEARYLKALQAAQRYEVDSQGQLSIFYKMGQESGVLRFASQNVRGLW